MYRIRLLMTVAALAPSLSAQVEPNAGTWKTWVLSSASASRLAPPPTDDSTAQELKWVQALAAARDQETLAKIRF
jgi:hypothetical protein